MQTEDELNRIAYEVRGACLRIHQQLGPGCFESAYAACFGYELQKRKLDFQTKVALPIRYEDLFIPRAYEPDFVVAGCLIVEVKACERLADIHVRQIDTYLRLSGCPLGLLVNFGAVRVLDGIVRRVHNFPHGTAPYSDRAVEASP